MVVMGQFFLALNALDHGSQGTEKQFWNGTGNATQKLARVGVKSAPKGVLFPATWLGWRGVENGDKLEAWFSQLKQTKTER